MSTTPPPAQSEVPSPTVDGEMLPIVVGTVIWAVLFLVGLLAHDRLARDGHTWWTWTAAVGVVLGLMATAVFHRRAQRLRS